ncbi:MAG: FAD-dependent oxidoreductase [Alphaproteobacteria bacterium]
MPALQLAYGLTFEDLYSTDGIQKLQAAYLKALPPDLDLLQEAEFLESFIAELFGITPNNQTAKLDALIAFKKKFIQRKAAYAHKENAYSFDGAALRNSLTQAFGKPFSEMAFFQHAEAHEELALQYAAWALHTAEGQKHHKGDFLFSLPQKIDPENLVDLDPALRCRDGFAHTDPGHSEAYIHGQAHYCIWCHKRDKDSCSKGLDNDNLGCPLEEKISEMNLLQAHGHSLAALAVVMIDNPMVAATGHRICNDCMKACIYQKQEPVDIPAVESHVLQTVLKLPWGVEVYSLLSRWNPLNKNRPTPLDQSGKAVLVAGMGPAGFTLAHHLLNDGHQVVGIDGLKIEPWQIPFEPIHDVEDIRQPLDQRPIAGFGGVAEYGITVRWDKNNLTLIRLLLQRRAQFQLYGGVRLGSTITTDQAIEMGFDHIALCMGAGKPTVLPIKNNLAKGVRQASDFLMALQLTGAAKKDSIANLEIRLPVVVIGGGLTAIDTATEALAYYPVQVEKYLDRCEALDIQGDAEFLEQGRAIRAERQLAEREGRQPNFIPLLQSWGGSTIAYRKRLQDAPSYRQNHEEVAKALEEGIGLVTEFSPEEVIVDDANHAIALKGNKGDLPARTILVAAGTKPNTMIAREEDGRFHLDGKYFQAYDDAGRKVSPEACAKPQQADILCTADTTLSFFGDLHPSFAGNVVKAMASAKRGYPLISQILANKPSHAPVDLSNVRAEVKTVQTLAPKIVEVIVHAPLAASQFRPGQFYRLQNFESNAPRVNGTPLAMEGIALTGAWADPKTGLLSLIILEMGGSSDICTLLKPGEEVSLMGPTGTPTEIVQNQNVLLIGGGLGNAVLFSIGKALRANGCHVTYAAGYRSADTVFYRQAIEEAADKVLWCCDDALIKPSRPQDLSFKGNIVGGLKENRQDLSLSNIDRMIVIGSDRMMAAVNRARHTTLKAHLKPDHVAIASINSPMQCMMKEICAQCIQRHIHPETGEETIIFSCVNQDQPMDWVDFDCLGDRLTQQQTSEELTRAWIKQCRASIA